MARAAINGLGRTGGATLRILEETPELELVAVNDLTPVDNLVSLLRYDTVYGRFPGRVEVDGQYLVVGGRVIRVIGYSHGSARLHRPPDQYPGRGRSPGKNHELPRQ